MRRAWVDIRHGVEVIRRTGLMIAEPADDRGREPSQMAQLGHVWASHRAARVIGQRSPGARLLPDARPRERIPAFAGGP
jgi:hypothetical protein